MNSVMLIGRILFAFMFIASGLNHFTKAEAMAGYAAYKKVPAPKLANTLSGALMVLGGLSVILGVYADLGAVVIAVLLVAMALKFIHVMAIPITLHYGWCLTLGKGLLQDVWSILMVTSLMM